MIVSVLMPSLGGGFKITNRLIYIVDSKPTIEKCTNKKILNYISLLGMVFMFIPVAATAPIDTTSWRCDTNFVKYTFITRCSSRK